MARQSITLAQICPADIIADNQPISDEDYELFDTFPAEMQRLEYAIAIAVTDLLPDELIVTEATRTDPDGHAATIWRVLQALDPATKTVGGYGPQDAATRTYQGAIAWLATPSRVAEAINLDALASEAVRHARLVFEADV